MDFFNCYAGFKHALEYVVKTSRPVIIEAITDRFRGHSISDPAVYRSKEDLLKTMARDPINLLKNALIEHGMLTEDDFKEMDRHAREVMIASMQFAEESPWPDLTSLEEGVFAPEDP
jgi:pyruvate dehydrogenase E1 component alpha subunit